jgi:hypothetical protein
MGFWLHTITTKVLGVAYSLVVGKGFMAIVKTKVCPTTVTICQKVLQASQSLFTCSGVFIEWVPAQTPASIWPRKSV